MRNQKSELEVKINWFRGESRSFVFLQLFVRIVLLQSEFCNNLLQNSCNCPLLCQGFTNCWDVEKMQISNLLPLMSHYCDILVPLPYCHFTQEIKTVLMILSRFNMLAGRCSFFSDEIKLNWGDQNCFEQRLLPAGFSSQRGRPLAFQINAAPLWIPNPSWKQNLGNFVNIKKRGERESRRRITQPTYERASRP